MVAHIFGDGKTLTEDGFTGYRLYTVESLSLVI